MALAYFVSSLAFVRAYRRLAEDGRAAKRRCVLAHLAIGAAILVVWSAGLLTGLALVALSPVAERTALGLLRPPPTLRQLGWREAAVATVFVVAALAAIARSTDEPDLTTVAEPDLAHLLRWLREACAAHLPALERIDLYDTPGTGAMLWWGERGPALPGLLP